MKVGSYFRFIIYRPYFDGDKEKPPGTGSQRKNFLKKATLFSEQPLDNWEDFLMLSGEVSSQDLLIVVSARKNTVSYHTTADKIPYFLSKYFRDRSFIMVYPEHIIKNEFGLV